MILQIQIDPLDVPKILCDFVNAEYGLKLTPDLFRADSDGWVCEVQPDDFAKYVNVKVVKDRTFADDVGALVKRA